jgi:zona occludens toxin (predicted ATPase)
MMLRRILLTLLALIALYAVYFLYAGPRFTGDSFVRALQSGDSAAIQAMTCQNNSLGSAALRGGAGAFAALGLNVGGESRHVSYTPFGGVYTFDWVIAGVGGLDVSTGVKLSIAPVNAVSFCVYDLGLA